MSIGNPISLTDNVASKIISVIATQGQTLFTVAGGYRINAISVFRNGIRLSESTDFTAEDASTVTLVNAANVGDELTFQIFDDFRVADAIVSAASTQTLSGNLRVTGSLAVDGGLTGAQIGVQSTGTFIGSGTTLNFIGTGNTFAVNGDTIDITIRGESAGVGTGINYSDGAKSPFSYIDPNVTVTQDITLNDANAGVTSSYVIVQEPDMIIGTGNSVTVDGNRKLVIDLFKLGSIE